MRVSTAPAIALLAGALASFAFAPPVPDRAASAATSASGKGTMEFGDDGHGRGLFNFTVTDEGGFSASLLFAAEDHHDRFPDVVVRLGSADDVRFGAHDVRFRGPGALHDDPVTVEVRAIDRGIEGKADRFRIVCTAPGGEVVLEAEGGLIRGDIVVGGE